MLKKIALCVLCLIIAFSVCVSAENSQTQSSTPDVAMQQGEMPREGRGGRMGARPRGGMGGPRGDNMQTGEGFTPPDMPSTDSAADSTPQENSDNTQQSTTGEESQNPTPPFGAGMMGRPNQSGFPGGTNNDTLNSMDLLAESNSKGGITGFFKEYSTPVFSLILLAVAFVFVIFYKRKRY